MADECIAVRDGLKGLSEAITTLWEIAQVQTCVFHMIRNTRHLSRAVVRFGAQRPVLTRSERRGLGGGALPEPQHAPTRGGERLRRLGIPRPVLTQLGIPPLRVGARVCAVVGNYGRSTRR
ncbi:transposase [Oerskovia sp. NPDC060287]|uniref:transposase n=1 Tax=Oerskovia sp. NPDC060287 TaxID=3347095 RepID=UPI0036668003